MKRLLKKKALLGIAMVAVLLGAGAAWSSVSSGAAGGATAVVGGMHRSIGDCFYLPDGTLTFCSGVNVDMSLDVHGPGAGPATGTFLAGTNGSTFSSSVRITCMTVVGNRAVVGGFITEDTSRPDVVGDEQLFYVIDNGGPGNAPLDKMSAREIYSPDQFTPGFPTNCGSPDATTGGYTDVRYGDVSIHAGL
jgi:hypothetical protein